MLQKSSDFSDYKKKDPPSGRVFLYFSEAVLSVRVISHYGMCSNTLSALV